MVLLVSAISLILFLLNDSYMKFRFVRLLLLFTCITGIATAQRSIKWTPDGNAYTKFSTAGDIVRVDPRTNGETVLVKKEQLTPGGAAKAMQVQSYTFNADNSKV